jgi:nucleotide-binding universal stress UspA family protein
MKGEGPMEDMMFKKILVPTDFSEYSKRGVCAAMGIARHFDSDLYFVNVWPPEFIFLEELKASADEEFKRKLEAAKEGREKKLREFVEQLGLADLRAHYLIKSGPPYLEIIIAARELEADLIVIGSHGLTGIASMLIGSVAEKVVRKAGCPVLTVKPEGFQCPEYKR